MKQQISAARFDVSRKMRSGMTGYFANFHSLMKKRPIVTMPKTMRQIVKALAQGWVVPPDSMPKRNITTPPMIVSTPSQSRLRRPATRGVRGLSSFRKMKSRMSETPSSGRLM
jgi:hypothetical protein